MAFLFWAVCHCVWFDWALRLGFLRWKDCLLDLSFPCQLVLSYVSFHLHCVYCSSASYSSGSADSLSRIKFGTIATLLNYVYIEAFNIIPGLEPIQPTSIHGLVVEPNKTPYMPMRLHSRDSSTRISPEHHLHSNATSSRLAASNRAEARSSTRSSPSNQSRPQNT